MSDAPPLAKATVIPHQVVQHLALIAIGLGGASIVFGVIGVLASDVAGLAWMRWGGLALALLGIAGAVVSAIRQRDFQRPGIAVALSVAGVILPFLLVYVIIAVVLIAITVVIFSAIG